MIPIKHVAILYSSSQNSLQNWGVANDYCPLWSQSFIHQVRILSGIDIRSWSALIAESQSFIHQVRILSGKTVDRLDWRMLQMPSQSFIHQVRILSCTQMAGGRNCSVGRSQSFIHQVRILSRHIYGKSPRRCRRVAILYSSSQNSLSQARDGHVFRLHAVAILYSSSQNSLLATSKGI